MNCIPLIGYTKYDLENTKYYSEADPNIKKFWILVKYLPDEAVDTQPRTAEFCFRARGMDDFCGGVYFFSPQVTIIHRAMWQQAEYITNASGLDSLAGKIRWEDLESNDDRAVDLAAFTGKYRWSLTELKDYGYQCIAESMMTEMIATCRRGFACADYNGGAMSTVYKKLIELTEGGNYHPLYTTRKIEATMAPVSNLVSSTLGQSTSGVTMTPHPPVEFVNPNSGSSVSIYTGSWAYRSRDGGPIPSTVECENCGYTQPIDCCDECHECGAYVESQDIGIDGRRELPAQYYDCIKNDIFVQTARRYDWSNG